MLKNFKKKQESTNHLDASSYLKNIDHQLSAYTKKDNSTLTHLEILGYLGEGTYAFVNLAFDHLRGERVALKIFDKKTLMTVRRLSNLIVS